MIRSAPAKAGHNSGTQAAQKLRTFLERIEHMQEERKALADDIADVFQEMESDGYDKHAAKVVLKIRKADDGLALYTERTGTVDAYLAALGMLPAGAAPHAGARARENIEEFPPQDGLAGPASMQDSARANTKPAPIPSPVEEVVTPPQVPTDLAAQSGDESAATDFEPPAFLKTRYVLRPHCRNPEECAGYGDRHCTACLKSVEAAA